MKQEMKVWIRGNSERGKEVIKMLEDLGGNNIYYHSGNEYYLDSEIIGTIYTISHDKAIIMSYSTQEEIAKIIMEEYKEIKLNKMQETKKIDASSITSYEQAIDFLGYENEASMLGVFRNARALIAIEKLIVIAEAWNKADNFVPDFDNCNQYKFFPWFMYKDKSAGLVYAGTTFTASSAHATTGSRLCFSTRERSEQFGRMFIDLWNEFLLQK